jgi:hypothetical protein
MTPSVLETGSCWSDSIRRGTLRFLFADVRDHVRSVGTRGRVIKALQGLGFRVQDLSDGTDGVTLPRNGQRVSVDTWHYADTDVSNQEGEVGYVDPKVIDGLVDVIMRQFVEDFQASNKSRFSSFGSRQRWSAARREAVPVLRRGS